MENMVDKRCKNADGESMQSMLEIAERCIRGNLAMQPTINQVPQVIEQEVMSPYPSDYS